MATGPGLLLLRCWLSLIFLLGLANNVLTFQLIMRAKPRRKVNETESWTQAVTFWACQLSDMSFRLDVGEMCVKSCEIGFVCFTHKLIFIRNFCRLVRLTMDRNYNTKASAIIFDKSINFWACKLLQSYTARPKGSWCFFNLPLHATHFDLLFANPPPDCLAFQFGGPKVSSAVVLLWFWTGPTWAGRHPGRHSHSHLDSMFIKLLKLSRPDWGELYANPRAAKCQTHTHTHFPSLMTGERVLNGKMLLSPLTYNLAGK